MQDEQLKLKMREFIHGNLVELKAGTRPNEDKTFSGVVRIECAELACHGKPGHGLELQENGFLEESDAKNWAMNKRQELENQFKQAGCERIMDS